MRSAWRPVAAAMLLLGIAGGDAGAARCLEAGAVATARARIATACACSGTRAAYRRCLATATAGLSSTVAPCVAAARRCAAASTCGRPNAVTCCTQRNGRSHCRIRRSAAACTSHGGTVKACPSCCDACGTSCVGETVATSTTTSTTATSTLPLQPCEDAGFPTCAGGCGEGQVCQALAATGSLDLHFCQCVPDDVTCATAPSGTSCLVGRCPPEQVCSAFLQGSVADCACHPLPPPVTTTTSTTIPGQRCGDTAYPACGGVCPTDEVCQAIALTGAQTGASCACVPSTGTCATVSGGTSCTLGPCPPGSACVTFTFLGGVECGCSLSTTTTVPGATTTSTVPPRGPCPPTDCFSPCAPGQVCQAIWVTGSATFNLCLCLDAESSCDGENGTCPGACPTGRTCGDQFVNGAHTGCGCLP